MFTYRIMTYYKEDGPYESWEQTFANPVHIGEQIEVEIDGFQDGVEYDVFGVTHCKRRSTLFCNYADALCEDSMRELREALRIRSSNS